MMIRNLLLLLLVLHANSSENTKDIEETLEHFLEELVGSEFLQRKFNVDSDLFESSESFDATNFTETRRKRALGWRNLFGNNLASRNGRQGFGGFQNFGAGSAAQNFGGLGLAGYTYNLINTIRLLSQGLGLGYLERISAVVKEVDSFDCIPRAICEYTANQTYQTRLAELRENEKKSENRTETTTTERPWYTRFAPRPENMPQYLTLLRALNIDQTNSFHIIRPAMYGVHKADVDECLKQYKACNGSYSDAFIDTVNNMEGGIVGALGRIGTLLGIGTNGLTNAASPASTAELFNAAGLGSLPGNGLAAAGQTAAALAANSLGGGQAANQFGFTQQQFNSLTPQQAQYYQQLLAAQQLQAQQASLAGSQGGQGGNVISLAPYILRGVNAIRGAFGNRNRRPPNPSGVPSLQDLIFDSDSLDPNDFDFESRNVNQNRESRGIMHRIPNRFDTGDPHPNAIPNPSPQVRNRPAVADYSSGYQGHYGGRQVNAVHQRLPFHHPPVQPQLPQNNKPVPYHVPLQGQTPKAEEHTRPIFRTTTTPSWRFLTSQEQTSPTLQPSHGQHRPAALGSSLSPVPPESRRRPTTPTRASSGKVLFRD